LERLAKLNDWTEEPARSAAAAIGEAPQEQGAPAATGSLAVLENSTEVQEQEARGEEVQDRHDGLSEKPAAKGRAATRKENKPWENVDAVSSAGAMQPVNFRLPVNLYQQLKYLGQTTYGESMNSIVIGAIGDRVTKMLKDRDSK
jgi:hypothetical protein